MATRKPQSFRMRSIAIALVAVVLAAAIFIAPSLTDGDPTMLFGLPLKAALALPLALPALVLIMIWFANRQNTEDARYRDDV